MLNKSKCLIITMVVILVYSIIQMSPLVKKKETNAPTITFDKSELVLSTKSSESDLLKGVRAYDDEDGDLTKNIVIENQSVFTTDHTRTVTYLVFDSDDNVTRNSRQVTYTDYTAPKFSLKDSLYQDTYSITKLMESLHAKSSVDGDISSKITVMNTSFEDNNTLKLKVSVTDSTNTTSFVNLNYYIGEKQDIEIVLKDYLIYLDKDKKFDYRKNIINVIEKNFQDSSLAEYVKIDVPEMNEPGFYEVTYSMKRSNGNIGKTTMIVVVE